MRFDASSIAESREYVDALRESVNWKGDVIVSTSAENCIFSTEVKIGEAGPSGLARSGGTSMWTSPSVVISDLSNAGWLHPTATFERPVFEVWTSQGAFDKFGKTLMPQWAVCLTLLNSWASLIRTGVAAVARGQKATALTGFSYAAGPFDARNATFAGTSSSISVPAETRLNT
jgi:hypothetical protein